MLKIGWSKRNITMDGPVAITGQFFQRISRGVLDSLWVTALVIDDGNEAAIIVSADMTSAAEKIIFEIRDAVKAKNPEIPVEKILLSATHSHTTPRYLRETGYDKAPLDGVEMIPPEEYRTFFVDMASDAVCEAYETRDAGSYAYGYDYAVVSHHRRPVYSVDVGKRDNAKPTSLEVDKFARMYGRTNDPDFDGYEGVVDSSAYFLFTFDSKENLTGAIINIPCPSQNSEVESVITASYWAQVRDIVKEKYGDIYILTQCASAGDMSPRILHAHKAEERKYNLKYKDVKFPLVESQVEMYNRCEIAERIMHAFDSAYSWASKERIYDSKVIHSVKKLKLDAWKITEEQYNQAKLEYEEHLKTKFVHTGNAYDDYAKNTSQSTMLARYEKIINRYLDSSDYREVEIHVIRIGDIAFASNPFELYINYQHRIQARSPFVQTFVVQLAASIGTSGYLCTERAAENSGYSANVYSCQVSPSGGKSLVEQTLDELNSLYLK